MGSTKKKQFPFRFDVELIELVKEKAKAQKRSLNNYIEVLLYKDVGNIPIEMKYHKLLGKYKNNWEYRIKSDLLII